MAEHIYLLTILLPLGAITLIFGMKYFSAAQRARRGCKRGRIARVSRQSSERAVGACGVARCLAE